MIKIKGIITMKIAGITILLSIIMSTAMIWKQHNQQADLDVSGKLKNESKLRWVNTPIHELAKSVDNEDVAKISEIVKAHPDWVNYQEPLDKYTLLMWAVGTEKYDAVEALLKCGADPNIATPYGETAIFIAASYSWVDYDFKHDPKYVKILLKYHADPNICFIGGEPGIISDDTGTSPLMKSIGCGIEKTRALIEAGADIDHKTTSGDTAAIYALSSKYVVEANYLIVDKKANVTEPYYTSYTGPGEDHNKKFYPVTLLRNWTFPLDSEEYNIKMKIVEEFKRQGVDYWSTKIPDNELKYIKKRYPNTWQEYIKKY
jgi:hypothetical protein